MKNKIRKDLKGKNPIKRMGQNFLINSFILKKIVQSAEIKKTDTVIEIGPGTGVLTEELLKTGCNIIAIEKDVNLVNILKEKFKNYKNIEIINGNILDFKEDFFPKKYKLVANIPYYITSVIIKTFLEFSNQPELIVLTIQKEVAQRICSNPPKMSLLSISVKYYSIPKIITKVSKKCFWPIPKVNSAVIKIAPFKKFNRDESLSFFKVVRAGFSSPRKQILNNLSSGLNIEKKDVIKILKNSNIDINKRPGELDVIEWTKITKEYKII